MIELHCRVNVKYKIDAIENAIVLRPIVEAPIVNVDEPLRII